jgi:POT family proton-dependent oligopeptide transporter
MVGWIGGFLETWSTTNFWLLHAAFAAASGLCFVAFKLLVSRRLEVEA